MSSHNTGLRIRLETGQIFTFTQRRPKICLRQADITYKLIMPQNARPESYSLKLEVLSAASLGGEAPQCRRR